MSDTSTRSGLLWEVERILTELKEKPQILLMENVPQVHGEDNKPDFLKWITRLEELGYKNYFQDLIATDYGIPQTRNRCFMISLLGDYSYSFPPKQELKLKLKDMLETDVPEKYYLSDKMINFFVYNTQKQKEKGNSFKFDPINENEALVSKTITTKAGSRMDDTFIQNKILEETLDKYTGQKVKADQFIDGYNRKIREYDLSCTITTRTNANNNNYIIAKEVKRVGGVFDRENKKRQAGSVYDSNGLCPTLDTMDGGYRQPCIQIKNATKQGYLEAEEGDGIDISGRMESHRGTVQKGKAQTLTTKGGDNNGVVVADTLKREMCNKLIQENAVEEGDIIRHSYTTQIMQGKKKYAEKNDGNMITLTTRGDVYGIVNNLRIRKLTPRECLRLMGLKDKEIDLISINQSDASLYHLAGDSIVVDVLMAIFKELL